MKFGPIWKWKKKAVKIVFCEKKYKRRDSSLTKVIKQEKKTIFLKKQ
jgi:hypothetical protein